MQPGVLEPEDPAGPIKSKVHPHPGIPKIWVEDARFLATGLPSRYQVNVRNMAGLEAISFSRTPQMQSIIMKHDVNF